MDALRDLELLITSRYPLIVIETFEEARMEEALDRVAERLRMPLFQWTVTEGLKRRGGDAPIYDTREPLKGLASLAGLEGDGIYLFQDLHRYLDQPAVVRSIQDLARAFARQRRALVLSAPDVTLPPELQRLSTYFTLALPGDEDLRAVARRTLDELTRQYKVKVELPAPEVDRLAEPLRGLTLFEAERALTRAVLRRLAVTPESFGELVAIKKDLLHQDGVLEYVPVDEDLSQIGGLEHLKTWLAKRAKALTPEARQFGIPPPRGVLLLGVQGCGKSMAAKAVARQWGLPLLRMEPSRLYDKYVGESDKNLEKALQYAEAMAPCVLIIDEIEKALAGVSSAEADGGVSRRIFGRLLGWLQERKAAVFVVATCNDIAQLPPELMRKGRFDEIFFLDLPAAEERQAIFTVHLKKRDRDPAAFDVAALAAASEGFSGAEIEQAVVAGLHTAFSKGTDVDTRILLDELAATRPLSVTRGEAIAALRDWARDRTVPASAPSRRADEVPQLLEAQGR